MNFDCNKTWKFKYDIIAKGVRHDIIRKGIDSLAILNVQFNIEFVVSDVLDLIIILTDDKMREYEF
jgi:hypothetical protein